MFLQKAYVSILVVFVSLGVASCSFQEASKQQTQNAPADEATIGVAEIVRGFPGLIRDGRQSVISPLENLHAGDILVTAKGSRVQLRLTDDTLITLGENTWFEISTYSDRSRAPVAKFKLDRGAFRLKTGALPGRRNATFEISTPAAVIGVRGTDFWGGDIFENAQIDVALLSEGHVYVTNEFGTVDIQDVGYGTTVVPGSPPSTPYA